MPATPKHPSVRRRRNIGPAFRILSGLAGDAPAWPLGPDTARTAELETLRDKVARLQVEIAATEDGRTRGRLTRQRDQNELAAARLALELEQATDAERALWDELWTYPQAQLWSENKTHRSVAIYVRLAIRAEQGDLKAATEARQWSDRLGLNDRGLLQLRAEVEQVEKAEAEGMRRRAKATQQPAPNTPDKSDPRDFLRGL